MTAFEIHKNVCTDQLWHLDFRVGVAEMMIWENYEAHRVWLGSPITPTPEQIRLDQIYHILVPTSQGYGMYCNTRLMCLKCDKWMPKKSLPWTVSFKTRLSEAIQFFFDEFVNILNSYHSIILVYFFKKHSIEVIFSNQYCSFFYI